MRLARSFQCLLAGAVFLAAAGCSSDAPTQSEQLYVTHSFGGFSADPGAADFTSAGAGTASGTIGVQGTMKLPASCYDMSTRVASQGQFVLFYVVAERRTGTCTAQLTQVSYSAVVSGANAGPHTVVVRHEIDEAFSTSVVDVGSTNVVVK